MPQVAQRTPADRSRAFTIDCMSDLLANVTLEASNRIANWRFDHLTPDNTPEGWDIVLPEEIDGIWPYLSAMGGNQQSMAAQSTAPLDLDEADFVDLDTPYVQGHSPKSKTFAARVAPPVLFASNVQVIQATKNGFEAGEYLLGYTLIKKLKRGGRGGRRRSRQHRGGAAYLHTRISPLSKVFVGQSQHIRFTLPDASEGVTHIGIWLSRPGKGASTIRLLKVVSARRAGEEYTLRGPYRSRRQGANDNEHRSSKRKRPAARKKKGSRRGRRGRYRSRVSEINPETGAETATSDWSEWVELTDEDVLEGTEVEFDPSDSGVVAGTDDSFQYTLYVQRDVDGEIEDYVYVNPDGVAGTTVLDYSDALEPVQAGRDSGGRRPQISGRTEEEDAASGRPSGRSGSLRRTRSTSTTSTEEEEEIKDPESPIEDAVGIGKTLITPGPYWVGVAGSVRGEETMLSARHRVTVATGQTIRVWIPEGINNLRNQQWSDLDSDGKPDGWTITGAGDTVTQGQFSVDAQNGEVVLDTVGLKTIASGHSTPDFSQTIAVDTADRWTFGGELNAAVTAGAVEVYLDQRNESGTTLATTIIKSLSSSADVECSETFGPGYTAWNPSTASVRLGVRFSGASRNGLVRLAELYAMAFVRRVRRRTKAHRGARRHSNSRPKSFVRWEKVSDMGVELPPAKFPTSIELAPLDVMNFEGGAVGAGWALRQDNASGVTAGVQTSAKISGIHGMRFQKTASGYRSQYLWKAFPPTTRSRQAARFSVRIDQLPTYGFITLAAFKSSGPSDYYQNSRAFIELHSNGQLYYVAQPSSGSATSWQFTSGIQSGDTLDIEMITTGGGSSGGTLQVGMGKNGATRTFSPVRTKIYWVSSYPRYIYLGPHNMSNSGALYNLAYDSVVITETGDSLTGDSVALFTEPIPLPSRPRSTATVEADYNFDDGLVPPQLSTARSPVDSTTNVTVGTVYAIDGGYGVRCQETSTALASAYVEELLATPVSEKAWRVRVRVPTLPQTGTTRLCRVDNQSGAAMAAWQVTSAGALQSVTVSENVETAPLTHMIGITAGTVLTLEIVISDAGATSGAVAFWAAAGGVGAPGERKLFRLQTGIPWTGELVSRFRAGIISSTAATDTPTVYVDSIVRTARGEVLFADSDSEGNAVYQVNYFLPRFSPVRDDLMVQNVRVAVRPNETYTFAMEMEAYGVEERCYPATVTAVDSAGNDYYLGDIYDRVGGCVGTIPWADQYLTFTVPPECFEIRISSRVMGHGEWTFQRPALCLGEYDDVVREVTYPVEGLIQVIFDTRTQGTMVDLQAPAENRWLERGAVYTVPEGCSVTAEYGSNFTTSDPTAWTTDASAVPQNRFFFARIKLYSDPTRRKSPEVSAGSPYVDFWKNIAGQQAPTLLRGDFTEFFGGTQCYGLTYPVFVSRWDIREPQGKVIRHRLTEPVGYMPGFTVRAFTQEAMTEIAERFLEEEFVLEGFGLRMTCKFKPPEGTSFGLGNYRYAAYKWYGSGETSTGNVEIISVDPIPGPWQEPAVA